jgi:hypothetical protein
MDGILLKRSISPFSQAEALTEENLNQWLSNYTIPIQEPKKVALILAGNIP